MAKWANEAFLSKAEIESMREAYQNIGDAIATFLEGLSEENLSNLKGKEGILTMTLANMVVYRENHRWLLDEPIEKPINWYDDKG